MNNMSNYLKQKTKMMKNRENLSHRKKMLIIDMKDYSMLNFQTGIILTVELKEGNFQAGRNKELPLLELLLDNLRFWLLMKLQVL